VSYLITVYEDYTIYETKTRRLGEWNRRYDIWRFKREIVPGMVVHTVMPATQEA
jgi:hypothetical protein